MIAKSKTPISDNATVDAGWIIASHSNGEFVPLSVSQELETKLTNMAVYADKLVRGLKMIASYDEDSKFGCGICPYGCDCPSIAQITLDLIKTSHSRKIET